MEKIIPLRSSEIPKDKTLFKLQLKFIEEGWTKEDCTVQFFRSKKGNIFGIIFNLDKQGLIEGPFGIILYIDDNANITEVNTFLQDHLLCEGNLERFSKQVVGIALQSSKFYEYVLKRIEEKIGSSYREEHSIFKHKMFKSPEESMVDIPMPQGYKIGPLLESHINFIVKYWAIDIELHSDPDTPAENFSDFPFRPIAVSNITERPGFGVFSESDPVTPVAWAAFYPGGDLGMLHVLEEHRGKKLGRIILRHMLKVLREAHGSDYRTQGFVKLHNVASLNLLLSEGWEEQPYNNKRVFFHEDFLKQLKK